MTATYVLIAAAGRGARFNTDPVPNVGQASLPVSSTAAGHLASGFIPEGRNKVFTPLLGKPILRWTVEAFAGRDDVDGIVVVVGQGETAEVREILRGVDKVMSILPGGANRQESVYIGLSCLAGEDDSLIAVHDGARPLVDQATINRCFATARERGNAVAAVPVVDTLKAAEADGVVRRTVEREGLFAVQTPQVFRWGTLARAHVDARDMGFVGTDEASVVENAGSEPINLVTGSPENIKVTRPADLRVAEALMSARVNPPKSGGEEGDGTAIIESSRQQNRVGFGYDVHRLAAGRKLFLGGVEFEPVDGKGLDGHSDADVLLHAICDALLGAAALPDIGHLFPNTDPAYAGISSLRLLEEVGTRLTKLGCTIVNVDATVIAERPKIAAAIPQMRDAIASALGIDGSRVGIKATTNEGLGSIGDGLGIAAHAVASVSL